MHRDELYFDLPKELIAQQPARPADTARLMVLDKGSGKIAESTFLQLTDYLRPGDLVVFNNSRVIPARLLGEKDTGGKVELILLKEKSPNRWEAIIKNPPKSSGKLTFSKKLNGTIAERRGEIFEVIFSLSGIDLIREIEKIGHMPTPPYITSKVKEAQYQTIFAHPQKPGSAAAPTAGLHFTKRLFNKLKKANIETAFITLHVGLGTFQPVKTAKVEDHKIHGEYYEVDKETLDQLHRAKQAGRRIVAVGTTTCRVLETIHEYIEEPDGAVSGETFLFVYPGYEFQTVDALITNFHTPYSSLLALVMAFAGQEHINKAYEYAVKNEYRFFSLGDGMLVQ